LSLGSGSAASLFLSWPDRQVPAFSFGARIRRTGVSCGAEASAKIEVPLMAANVGFPKEGQGFRAEVKIGDEIQLVLM
jgi:hypothetical protein